MPHYWKSPRQVMLLTAARLLDGTGTTTVHRPWIRVSDDRIDAIGSGPIPPGEVAVDFPGCTILPGLIDTHVHLVFAALATHEAIIAKIGRESDEQLLEQALASAKAALLAGITTVRDCGGRGQVIQRARDRIRRGEAQGAEILACGAPIT